MPVTRRERSAPSHGSAPVNAAISATLKSAPRAKKLNSVTSRPLRRHYITRQDAIPKPNRAADRAGSRGGFPSHRHRNFLLGIRLWPPRFEPVGACDVAFTNCSLGE